MKKVLFLFTVMVLFTACKSHKDTIVNARAEFDANVTWTLGEMRVKEVAYGEGQPKVTIQINPEAGTFSGRNGCNRYFGNFKYSDDGSMELSEIGSTKMACPENFRKLESSFMQLLNKCDGYELEQNTLKFKQGDKVLLTFEIEN